MIVMLYKLCVERQFSAGASFAYIEVSIVNNFVFTRKNTYKGI